jgi:hypothetical protein
MLGEQQKSPGLRKSGLLSKKGCGGLLTHPLFIREDTKDFTFSMASFQKTGRLLF